jgi:hypothetical protein
LATSGKKNNAHRFAWQVLSVKIIEFRENAALYTQVATDAAAIRTGGTAVHAIKGKPRHAHILVLTSINHLAGVLHKAGVAGIGRIWCPTLTVSLSSAMFGLIWNFSGGCTSFFGHQ